MSRALDSLSLALSQGTGIIVKIVTVPLLLTWIGNEGYALFNWSVVASGYLALMIPPISSGAYVLVVQALSDNDEPKAWLIQQVQLAMSLITGSFLFVLFFLIPLFLSPPSSISMRDSMLLFGLIGASTLFETLNMAFHGVLFAKRMFRAVAIRESIVSLVASLISIGFAWKLKSPVSLAVGLATGSLITLTANAVIIRKQVSKKAVAVAWDRSIVLDISRLCLKTYLHRASLTVSATVDRFLFPFVVSMERLAPYSVAGQVPNTLQRLTNPVLSTYSPDVTAQAKNNNQASIDFLLKASCTVMAVSCCIILIPCGAMPVVLKLWLGSHFNSQGPLIALFLGMTACLDLTVGVFNDYAYGLRKQHLLVYCTITRIIVMIPAILILVRPFGIAGIAMANFVSLLLSFPIYLLVTVKGLKLTSVLALGARYLGILAAGLLVAVPTYAMCWQAKNVGQQLGLLATLMVTIPAVWILLVKSKLVSSSINPLKRSVQASNWQESDMKEETPLVSIVLPTYNGSRYIKESIESVLAQTYQNWELIIVDDCSTDNTAEICKEYEVKDKRVKVIKNEVNLKLPASLNRGFEAAVGEYLTWTSDDNLYEQDAVETLSSCLSSNSEVGLAYTDARSIDENGQDLGVDDSVRDEQLVVVACNIGACFMYRREVYNKIGHYDTNMFTAEDYDYWLRIYSEFKFRRIRKQCYRYRIHSGSLSASKVEMCNVMARKAIEKNVGYILSRRPEALPWILLGYAIREWRAQNYGLSRRYIFSVLRLKPSILIRHGRKAALTAIIGTRLAGNNKSLSK